MIQPFVRGLPYDLSELMVREYESKVRDLKRWTEHSKSQRVQRILRRREAIEFILALGIYYRYLVAPFLGAQEFVQRLNNRGVELEFGGKILGEDFRSSIDRANRDFYRISTEFGLPGTFFAQTDIRRIVLSLIDIEERQSRAR
jgi:hypothetical protein